MRLFFSWVGQSSSAATVTRPLTDWCGLAAQSDVINEKAQFPISEAVDLPREYAGFAVKSKIHKPKRQQRKLVDERDVKKTRGLKPMLQRQDDNDKGDGQP